MTVLRLWLIIGAILAGALFVACGGDDDGDDTGDGEEPTATTSVEEEPTEEATVEEGGGDVEPGADEAFANVPLPEGASEDFTATYSGSEASGLIPPGADVDVGEYNEVTFKSYTVDGAAEDVLNFYKDRQGDWEEAYSFSSADVGVLVWTRDGGARAVWISVGEADGSTQLAIWEASPSD